MVYQKRLWDLQRSARGALADVCAKRCAECREQVPRTFYTRMLKPENNRFLLAPLAKSAGGTQQCGRAVFASTDDPDYQRILRTFEALQKLLELRPRADMPGFQLECDVPTGLDGGGGASVSSFTRPLGCQPARWPRHRWRGLTASRLSA